MNQLEKTIIDAARTELILLTAMLNSPAVCEDEMIAFGRANALTMLAHIPQSGLGQDIAAQLLTIEKEVAQVYALLDIEDLLPSAESLVADPGTSFWLKSALAKALDRDPVDAANDAEILRAVLSARASSILGEQA